jgi:hypothetical protein
MATDDNEKKAPKPCESYFGNVCSGFGGSLTCFRCGWHKFDHEPTVTGLPLRLAGQEGSVSDERG